MLGEKKSKEVPAQGFKERFAQLISESDRRTELLAVLDVSDSAFRQWIGGYSMPTAEKLVKIAKFFDVSLDFLMGLRNEQTPSVEIQGIVETLKLTEGAIEKIKNLPKNEAHYCKNICVHNSTYCAHICSRKVEGLENVTLIDILNRIIEEDCFKGLVQSIGNYVVQYERYLVDELIPYESRMNTDDNDNKREYNEARIASLINERIPTHPFSSAPNSETGGALYLANEALGKLAFSIVKKILPLRVLLLIDEGEINRSYMYGKPMPNRVGDFG